MNAKERAVIDTAKELRKLCLPGHKTYSVESHTVFP